MNYLEIELKMVFDLEIEFKIVYELLNNIVILWFSEFILKKKLGNVLKW